MHLNDFNASRRDKFTICLQRMYLPPFSCDQHIHGNSLDGEIAGQCCIVDYVCHLSCRHVVLIFVIERPKNQVHIPLYCQALGSFSL